MSDAKKVGPIYMCSLCREQFEGFPDEDEEWNDEMAKEELKKNFGDVPLSECSVICDYCYKLMGLE